MSFDKLAKLVNRQIDLDPSRFSKEELIEILMASVYQTGLVTPVEFSSALNLMRELTRLAEATENLFQDFDKDPRFADAVEAMEAARNKLKEARAKVKILSEAYCAENKD